MRKRSGAWVPLAPATTPPQRTWVGLTDEELELLNDCGETDSYKFGRAIESKLREKNAAQPAPVQEPMAIRMPKVGDKVVCLEDESLGTVVYLTAGGSPEIKFDDGSHGTYLLREFAELFAYTTPPAAPVRSLCVLIFKSLRRAYHLGKTIWLTQTAKAIRQTNGR